MNNYKDYKDFDYWYSWAIFYLNSNFGNLLPGISHNLQNMVHSYTMQLELWDKKLEANKLQDSSEIAKAVKRFHSTTQELSSFCDQLEQRVFYQQNHTTAVYLHDFIKWQQDYWINNLFFKHYITISTTVEEDTPTVLEIPPIILTLTFEEVLKNAIEACYAINSKGHFNIKIQLSPYEQGIEMTITSPTRLDNSLDPWLTGSSSKNHSFGMGLPLVAYFSEFVGWSCELKESDGLTHFNLKIPALKYEVGLPGV